jgi:LppX_LprAFG lipoprotein
VGLPRRAALLVVALLLLAAPAVSACTGGGSSDKGQTADQLLAAAKRTLDAAKSLHFQLSSTGAPAGGTSLTGGEGDVERPSSFAGTLKVTVSGVAADLKVVSVDHKVYAQLPLSSGYQVIDPSAFGFGDPGALLDPQAGISQLLTAATDAKLGEKKRVNGEVVQEVTADLPGDLVQKLLTSKDPSKPVKARMAIATSNDQLRQVQLTGPFFLAERDGSYTLQLTKYGADVSITAPPVG